MDPVRDGWREPEADRKVRSLNRQNDQPMRHPVKCPAQLDRFTETEAMGVR
jgi:hypothetical protein